MSREWEVAPFSKNLWVSSIGKRAGSASRGYDEERSDPASKRSLESSLLTGGVPHSRGLTTTTLAWVVLTDNHSVCIIIPLRAVLG